jgi:hypothetical protein
VIVFLKVLFGSSDKYGGNLLIPSETWLFSLAVIRCYFAAALTER